MDEIVTEELNTKAKIEKKMTEYHDKVQELQKFKAIKKQDFIIEGKTIMDYIYAKKVFHEEYKNTLRKKRV